MQEHLHHKTLKSAIKDHFDLCDVLVFEKNHGINSFKVIHYCNIDYETKDKRRHQNYH